MRLRTGQRLHRRGIARIRLGRGQSIHRRTARSGDRLQGIGFVLHVALGGLDQVRDQVVATLQLHVDLRERILVAVARGDETIVDADQPQTDDNDDGEQN